jgi:excisionase family DNA binding protein
MNGDLVAMLRTETVIPVSVAARAVGITKDCAYKAIRAGRLPSVRIGGAVRVPTRPLRAMLGIEPATA